MRWVRNRQRIGGWHNRQVPKLFNPSDPNRDPDVEFAVQLYGSRPRHAIVRFLSQNGGSFRGEIAAGAGISAGAIGAHLEVLEDMGVLRADVPDGERAGRSVRYSVDASRVRELGDAWLRYALED